MHQIYPAGFFTYLRHSSTVEWVTNMPKYFHPLLFCHGGLMVCHINYISIS